MSESPTFHLEQELGGNVAGVDEAGCGPWAGPVIAAAVIFLRDHVPDQLAERIQDSKKLTKKARERVFSSLIAGEGIFLHHGVGIASVEEIDQMNIGKANRLAMQRALQNLVLKPDAALVDGIRSPQFDIPTHMIIKGDQRSYSIAAASIIAKVKRDQLMAELDCLFPHYGWAQNAGYGTAQHIAALKQYGITPHHRRSFAPIKAFL